MDKRNRSCEGCKYAWEEYDGWRCDYIGYTGMRRPCPIGPGCTVRDDGYRGRKQIDPVRARDLYDKGLLDPEIGAELGVSTNTVFRWRQKNGLPANGRGGRPKAPELEGSTQ